MSECKDSTSGSVRPNLSCPADLSQLLFRFVERKQLGIVKGREDLAVMDMTQFFLPLNGYMMSTFSLDAGDSMRIESGTNMDYGRRREIQQFDLADLVTASLATDQVATISVGNADGTNYTTASGLATTSTGTGTGLTVDITGIAGVVTAIAINNPGSGYTVSDVITIVQTGSTLPETFTISTVVSSTATLNVTEGVVDHGTLAFDAGNYADFIANLKSAISLNSAINGQIQFNTDHQHL